MGKEHVISCRDEKDPRVASLDTNNGYVYDKAGVQIGHWEPVETTHTKMLADYAQTIQQAVLLGAMATVDPWRAKATAEQGEMLVRMDVGPGDVHIPSAMPNFASGYKNEPPMADMFAPPLLVDKPSDDFYQFDRKDAFQRAMPSVGAAGAQVNEIAPRFANDIYKTLEYALAGFTTTQVEAASDSALRIKQATAKRIMRSLILEREIRVANAARLSTNWDSSVYATLDAAHAWNGGVSSNPISDILTRVRKSSGAVTAIIWSEDVWHAFLQNPGVQKYVTFKDNAPAFPSVKQLQEQFGPPPIYVAKMRYLDTSGNLVYVWGGDAVLVRQPEQMPPTDQEDVATAYTFRWNGTRAQDGVVSNGMVVREYYVQDRGSAGGMKCVVLHQDAEKFTSKFVGGLIAGAVQ